MLKPVLAFLITLPVMAQPNTAVLDASIERLATVQSNLRVLQDAEGRDARIASTVSRLNQNVISVINKSKHMTIVYYLADCESRGCESALEYMNSVFDSDVATLARISNLLGRSEDFASTESGLQAISSIRDEIEVVRAELGR